MEQIESVFEYSSFGRRAVAFLLDALILVIPCAVANNVLPLVGGLAIAFLYAPILESSDLKASLGKYLMGIQVVDLTGRRLTLKAATLRYILKIVSSALLFIPYFSFFFTEKRQTLHDLLVDSVVIYGRSQRAVADAWMESLKELFSYGQPTDSDASVISQLERLQSLRERGAISEEEFQAQKAKILARS